MKTFQAHCQDVRMDETALLQFQMHGQDIPWLLGHWADRKPDHPALVWAPREGASKTWTYRQLLEDVQRLAAGLVARGISKGDKVLIHSENSPEMVLSWLACGMAGAVGVTTNTKSVTDEMAYFASHTGAVAAITQPQYVSLIQDSAPGLKWIAVTEDNSGEAAPADQQNHGQDSFESLFASSASDWKGREAEPMLPHCIMFTSGTTSLPKAVVHTHANAVWASRTGPRNIDLGTDDTYLIYLPFFHTNAQTWSYFSVLGVGATAVLMPKWSVSSFWPNVQKYGVTHISFMPFVMGCFMQEDRPKDTKLRVGVFGALVSQMTQAFGIGVYAAFGMTETVTHCVTGKPWEQWPDRSMGHVTPGYEIAVVDKETGELCPEGVTGEMWIKGTRGIQLFLEYYENPEANAKAFHDGWFKTGDMVQMGPGGNVFYQERDKDLLKVGGENVSAKQVEDVIVALPAVQSVAVVGKQHDFLGEVAVAFVIKAPGDHDEAALTEQIQSACGESLASFKVPKAVYYVDAFPTGTLDKILKNKLREMADAQPPVP